MLAIGGTLVVPKELAHADKIHKQINEEEQYLQADNGVAEQLYADWLTRKIQLEQNKRRAGNQFNVCSCVSYGKYRTGYSQSVGNAKNWPRNSTTPIEGGIVITNESSRGHVAYIEKVYIDEIQVIEANYHSCQISRRTIKLNDSGIIGFWDQNK